MPRTTAPVQRSTSLLPSVVAMVLGGFLLITAINVSCTAVRYSESFSPAGVPSRVIIHSDAGLVEVVAGDELRIQRDIRAREAALRLSHAMVDGVLMLEAHCATLLPCAVDTRVTLPAAVPVEIDLGVGEVWATGISDLTLELDEGDADVELSGQLQASVGSGDVHARMASGQHGRIAVGRGAITVEVPDADWRIDGRGREVSVEGIDSADEAAGTLELVAPGGSISVTRAAGFAVR